MGIVKEEYFFLKKIKADSLISEKKDVCKQCKSQETLLQSQSKL